jgi:hypothetical protein
MLLIKKFFPESGYGKQESQEKTADVNGVYFGLVKKANSLLQRQTKI